MVGIRCVKMRHELCAKVATGRNVRTMYGEVPQCVGTSYKLI
jgi:hypothetical protein